MITTFLFWNLKERPLQDVVANLAFLHSVDVVMLAECKIPMVTMLQKLNPHGKVRYRFAPSKKCSKVVIYSAFPDKYLQPIEEIETDRLTIRQLQLPSRTKILLAVTHFHSKRERSDMEQAMVCPDFFKPIQKAENKIGHTRTVLVGDLNMNPFEMGVTSVHGLHAVMTREIALGEKRTVNHVEYPFFYNPMWGLWGNIRTGEPPGTHYYNNSKPLTFFWNLFDQVLIRPSLLSRFQDDSLKILTTDGQISFLSRQGHPDRTHVSDHLPILFNLDL